MDRRIMGIETEFGITCIDQGRPVLGPDEVARYLFRKVVTWGRSSNVFLPNGARLYLDVGSHPEYATAECDSIEQLVTHDVSGAWILDDLVADAQRRLAQDGIAGTVVVLKNNVDSAGNSYGCHENYLVDRGHDFDAVTTGVLPFLISRQLIVGAGKLVVTSAGANYAVSQRADHMWEGVSASTTRSRPMINTRDEPHADAAKYRRMHVIAGDSSMAEPTTMLKAGSMHLVLALLETGARLPDLTLAAPMRAIREIALDPSGACAVELAAGGTITAHDLQAAYLEQVRGAVVRGDIYDPLAERILDLWERTLRAVETGTYALVDTEIDWVIKHKLLTSYADRHGMEMSHPAIARLDLAYHDVNRRTGVFHLLQQAGAISRVTTDGAIELATTQAPTSTRAALRGRFVEAAIAQRRDYSVDWVHLKLNDASGRTVVLKDPFSAADERVDRLIAQMVD